MPPRPLLPADRDLVAAASDLIARNYAEGRHHIAAAVRTASGRVYLGLHLDTYVGRASICAEAIAVGRAYAEGDREIVAIASVRHPRPREATQEIKVVSPCGICREMLTDFAPRCEVVVPQNGDMAAVLVGELLPAKYVRPR
ncbi:MAG: cytidine deaminase [Alphaproteobacteria bacterium]|nr:cytidine deaminase [Alphaproteobacteria bacterium]